MSDLIREVCFLLVARNVQDEINPKHIHMKGGPISSVRVPEDFPGGEKVVLSMEEMVMPWLCEYHSQPRIWECSLVCLSLGPAQLGNLLRQKMSLLCMCMLRVGHSSQPCQVK